MSPVVIAPVLVLVVALGVTAWLATRVTRSLTLLQAEVATLASLAAAHDRLTDDVNRTRRTFARTAEAPTDVWPPGRDR